MVDNCAKRQGYTTECDKFDLFDTIDRKPRWRQPSVHTAKHSCDTFRLPPFLGFPLVTKPRSVSFLLCTSWLDSLSQKMTLRPSSKLFVPKILWLAWHWHCWETGETGDTTKHNDVQANYSLFVNCLPDIICQSCAKLPQSSSTELLASFVEVRHDNWPSTNSLEDGCDNHPTSSE